MCFPGGCTGRYKRNGDSGERWTASQLFHTDGHSLMIVSVLRHPLVQVGAAVALTAAWVVVFVTGSQLATVATVAVSGLAVLGASFLLAWGAETAEKDVPRAFAIAVLAVLAVAPEYAVDALYAWSAGSGGATTAACAELPAAAIEAGETTLAAACHDANLAIANMTGANRILIGIGWAGIALFTVYRAATTNDPAVRDREGWLADAVTLDRDIATEVAFLFLALRGPSSSRWAAVSTSSTPSSSSVCTSSTSGSSSAATSRPRKNTSESHITSSSGRSRGGRWSCSPCSGIRVR
jgi:cation:H+ antiporter